MVSDVELQAPVPVVRAIHVPFREAKPYIQRRLRQAKTRDRYQEWVTTLREEAYIEIY